MKQLTEKYQDIWDEMFASEHLLQMRHSEIVNFQACVNPLLMNLLERVISDAQLDMAAFFGVDASDPTMKIVLEKFLKTVLTDIR